MLVGADGRARVADFGLARADHDAAPGDRTSPTDQPLELSLTATGAVLGTPAYMSPEQHMGLDVAAASDQFSFCVALWEALCGQRPFADETYAETSVAVLTGQLRDPPPAARLPRRLVDALRRGLATRPEQRHPDMPALLAILARDAPRTRGPWLAAAVLSTMAAGTAFALADWRAGEASACTGAAAELADTWDDDRRAAVAAALPEPTRALVGLDRYADEWTAAHRDACLDHRRGELSAARFDDRARCLDRRRRALASAVDVLTAPGTAPDSAQVVARLPSIATCNDPEAARLATYVPGDPALADVVRDLDDRLLAAQTRHHAGDLTGARATLAPVIAEARALDIRPLLGESLLLLGQLDAESLQPNLGRPSFAEAAVHALASQRDALAAEALARQIFVDAHLGATDRALEAAPIARALAERLPAPAAALARLEHNLGTVHLLGLHDRDAALAKFRRAAADLTRAADHDPLELANYSLDVAVATRDPDERRSEFTRAEQLLSERLGPDHVRTLEVQWQRGLHEPVPRTAAALLAEVCPRLLALHPELHESCAYCFYNLGLLRGELAPTEPALAELTRQDECEDHTSADPGLKTAIAIRRGSASAFTALAAGRPADALADTDAALVLTGPHRDLWWISAYHAELQLARGRALAALGRPDEARTALTEAIAGLETAGTMRPLPVYSLWLPSARALLGRLEP